MPPNTKVCINGFVLSTMLYDCVNRNSEQEGFLYGRVSRNVRDEINDSNMAGTQEDIVISISSSMQFGRISSFYDEKGRINRAILDSKLMENRKNVIGWYRYRRYSPLYPSTREGVVHQHLREYFDSASSNGSRYFVYAVFSSSNLPNFATHSYDYAFFTQRTNFTFRPLNVTLLNLGDTRNSYRSGSMALPFADSPSFNSVIQQIMNLHCFHELEDNIQSFHLSLRSKLSNLQEELAASDAVNESLEHEIKELTREIQVLTRYQEENASSSLSASTSRSAASHSPASSKITSEAGPSKQVAKVTPLKRPASEAPPQVLKKRQCVDKYFENGLHVRVPISKPASKNVVKVTSPKPVSEANPQLMAVDPDNGENGSRGVEKNAKPQVFTAIKDFNTVPSPSSTVEVVISNAGSQSNDGDSDIRSHSSPESVDVRESSSDPVSSPADDNAKPGLKSNSTDAELGKTVNKEVANAAHSVPTTSALSNEAISCDTGKKTSAPFIVYATRKTDDVIEKKASSNNQEKVVSGTDVGKASASKENKNEDADMKEKE